MKKLASKFSSSEKLTFCVYVNQIAKRAKQCVCKSTQEFLSLFVRSCKVETKTAQVDTSWKLF